MPRPEATIDTNKTVHEQDTLSRPVVTDPAGDLMNTAMNVINIVPSSEQAEDGTKLQQPITEKELELSRAITTRSVVTQIVDMEATGETSTKQTNTQQRISEDYAVPEEIASEALLMLQTMSQSNSQELEEDDDYALPVGIEKLPDLVCEMKEERGIKTIVNYDAQIPDEMRLQTDEPTKEMPKEGDRDKESDETIIYDASEFEQLNIDPKKQTEKQIEDSEKSLKGQLTTQTFGIIRRKHTSKRTYTCIHCGAKHNSKQEINQHYQEEHSSIKCPDCDRVFPTPDSLQRHRYTHAARDKFVCDKCEKDYPFESDLNRHKIKHRNKEIKTHVCMAAGCERSFMRKADLVSHAQNHMGKVHKCDQCEYSAMDIRYLKQHQQKHSNDLRIKCNICGRGFRYFTQMKRHHDRDH